MNNFKYLFFLVFIFFKTSFAQEILIKEVEFEPIKFLVEDRFFNISRVIDARMAPSMYGDTYIKFKKHKLVSYTDLGDALTKEFNKQFPAKKDLIDIVIKINRLEISQVDNAEPKRCKGNMEVFIEKNKQFLKIGQYNISVSGDYINLPYIFFDGVFEFINKREVEISNIEQRKEISEDELLNGQEIAETDKVNSGIFRFFEDYKSNTPSKYYTDLISENPFPSFASNFELGKHKKGKINYKDLEVDANFWGYRNGKNLYYRIFKNVFVRVYEYQGDLLFDATNVSFNFQELEYKSTIRTVIIDDPIATITADAISALIELSRKNKVLLYKIDMKSGYYFPYQVNSFDDK